MEEKTRLQQKHLFLETKYREELTEEGTSAAVVSRLSVEEGGYKISEISVLLREGKNGKLKIVDAVREDGMSTFLSKQEQAMVFCAAHGGKWCP